MLKKFIARLLVGALALAALTSCGDSKASGTGQFATVFVTASAPTTLDADLAASWTSPAGASQNTCSAGFTPTIAPDSVDYVITSTAYSAANTGSTNPTVTSDLLIKKITLTLTPAVINGGTPALPSIFQTQYPSSGQLVKVGTNSIPVQVATRELKAYLADLLGLGTACTSATFHYRAVVSFEAEEVNTGRVSTITAPGFLTINFGDFVSNQ